MQQQWLDPFLEKKGEKVQLKGNTSCSRSPAVALKFALDGIQSDKVPVLFLKCILNFWSV